MSKKILTRTKFNGMAILVAMFRDLDPISRKKMYGKLSEVSPILVKLIEKHEFIFSDLTRLDDKSLQKVISLISEEDLLLAWKLAPEVVKEVLLKNMSSRRKDLFLSEVASAQKVHKIKVYKAQQRIAQLTHTLLSTGKLSICSKYR